MVLLFFLVASVASAEEAAVEVGASGAVHAERKHATIRFHTHGNVRHDSKAPDEHIQPSEHSYQLEDKAKPKCPVDVQNGPDQKIVRVLSDFHAGGCWFRDPVVQKQVMTLLERIADGTDLVDELVLLGDIFEFHLTPLNETQLHPSKLFAMENAYGFDMPKFLSFIRKISMRTQTYFIRGNHDEEANTELINEAFGPCVKHMGYGFSKYGVWFEHGHNADLWNRMYLAHPKAPKRGDKPLISWGYYVTRASHASNCRPPRHGGEPRSLGQQLADYWYTNISPKEPRVLLDAEKAYMQSHWEKMLLNIMSNALDEDINTPEDLRKFNVVGADAYNIRWGDSASNFTLYDAFNAHKDQFANTITRLSHGASIAMIHAMLQDFSKWAARDTKHDIIIAGHTHRPVLQEVTRVKKPLQMIDSPHEVREKVVYVNSGGWVQSLTGETSRTYVDLVVGRHSPPLDSQVVRKSPGLNQQDLNPWRVRRVEIFEYPQKSLYAKDLS